MKTFNVRHAETFLWDMIDITLYILEESESTEIPRRFYDDVLAAIEDRAFGADSYETYYPWVLSSETRHTGYPEYQMER